MKPENYSIKQRLDDVLDKISKYGIDSLTALEKEFLDSHNTDRQDEFHDKMNTIEQEAVFKDDFGNFKFEYKESVKREDGTHHIGNLYVPDFKSNNKVIEGMLFGSIIVCKNGQTIPNFKREKYDVFEFCEGLEYELDNFLDYVVQQLNEKNDI